MSENLAVLQKQLSNSIRMENDKEKGLIKLEFIKPNIKENLFVKAVIENSETIKQFIENFVNHDNITTIEVKSDLLNNIIEITASEKELYSSVSQFLDNFIFGHYLKNFDSEMSNKFTGMFGKEFKL